MNKERVVQSLITDQLARLGLRAEFDVPAEPVDEPDDDDGEDDDESAELIALAHRRGDPAASTGRSEE